MKKLMKKEYTKIVDRLSGTRFFHDLLTDKSFQQFRRYFITGLLSFSLEYLLFIILYRVLSIWYILANTIVYVLVFWFNFLINRVWSFKSKENLKIQLAKYSALFVFNLLCINALLYLLSDITGLSPLLSKVFVMGAVVLWNFVIYKKIIYK